MPFIRGLNLSWTRQTQFMVSDKADTHKTLEFSFQWRLLWESVQEESLGTNNGRSIEERCKENCINKASRYETDGIQPPTSYFSPNFVYFSPSSLIFQARGHHNRNNDSFHFPRSQEQSAHMQFLRSMLF